MQRWWQAMVRRQEGQSMAEYGLILALIAILAVAAVMAVGSQLSAVFENIKRWLGG